jgi:hypothetical protein
MLLYEDNVYQIQSAILANYTPLARLTAIALCLTIFTKNTSSFQMFQSSSK